MVPVGHCNKKKISCFCHTVLLNAIYEKRLAADHSADWLSRKLTCCRGEGGWPRATGVYGRQGWHGGAAAGG